MARTAAAKLLGARVFKLYRAVGSDGEQGADILDQNFLFDAEATTNARFDDANTARRQANDGGNDAAHMVGHLRAGAHNEAIILIPVGDDDVVLDGCLL